MKMWQLELGDEVVAQLAEESCDFPWTYARLLDTTKFQRFRTYFSADEYWPETPEFATLCAEIHAKGGFVLRNLATRETHHNVTLHHESEQVWFRYS